MVYRTRNKWKHYNTTLVSDPPFSCLPSSVLSVSACKHKLVLSQLELDVGVHVCLWTSLYSHSITII